ncbi:MAG TPA: hypothetical protein VGO55_00080 [Allosphingosinicella sp.]|jgi:hypothetical protein|nr:hypothetical protein [Allosphingosinicella sp.]
MGSGPALHYHLPARRPGSFGSSAIGRVAESATLTWFRFELVLAWLAVVIFSLAIPWSSFGAAALVLMTSPITALALVVLLKLCGWVFYFVPGMGKLWGWGRVIFLRAFSRLVAQPAPVIELPAWAPNR